MSRGKQPRPSAKVPKSCKVYKDVRRTQTTRMLAQKQPPFKECVTAYWSMFPCAENVRGLKHDTEATDSEG